MSDFVCLSNSGVVVVIIIINGYYYYFLLSSYSASFLNSWWSLCDNWDSHNMLLHIGFIPEATDSVSSFLPCLGKISTWMKASWL